MKINKKKSGIMFIKLKTDKKRILKDIEGYPEV